MNSHVAFLMSAALAVWSSGTGFAPAQETWEGPKLKPVPRQDLFEFSEKPTFKRLVGPNAKPVKDRYVISFASKGRCDVAVAIENAKGQIVNHIVCGVLGPNAPAPLKKGSLKQRLIWNGKNDLGEYVEDPEQHRCRVSLGLNPTFDRTIGWHPQDTIGPINGIGADEDGVYVISAAGYWQAIKAYGHDAKYVRTILPFPADKTESLKGVPTQKLEGLPRTPAPRTRYGKLSPYDMRARAYTIPVVSKGRIAWLSHGYKTLKHIFRIGTDGTTRGISQPIGPHLSRGRSEFVGGTEMAASPDGKWLYVTKLRPKEMKRGAVPQHAVYRLAWDEKGPISKVAFIGDAKHPGSNNETFKFPGGIATDRQGRLYVSDTGNSRIQVFDSEGKHLKTILAKQPQQIQVHQKTGEIYYTSFALTRNVRPMLFKLSAMPNTKEIARLDLVKARFSGTFHGGGDFKSGHDLGLFMPIFCLDSWSTPAKVWLVPASSRIVVYADKGDKFELAHDLDADVRKDGYTPHAFNGYKMNRISADRVRGHLYYVNSIGGLMRCDAEIGKAWDRIRMPASGWGTVDGFQIGYDGYLYIRAVQHLARFDPARFVKVDDRKGKGLYIPVSAEIPFNYGERKNIGWGGKGPALRGVLKLPAQVRGNGFDMGMGVSPLGNILAICQNYHKQTNRFESRGTTVPKLDDMRYRPRKFPGRHWYSGGLCWVWDKDGEIIGEDVVKAMHGASCGIRSDKQGNLYVGLAAWPLRDGKKFLPTGHGNAGPGALLKFPPTGGRVYGTWGGPVKLKDVPKRPPEFQVAGKLWTQNLLWSYPGMSTMTITDNTCTCPQSRFDVDVYGRSFVPESWRYSVGVCDTNGNPITHVGRYGNMDSGRGANSSVPVEGGIAFSQTDYVCVVSDRWLYVADTGNWRVVRVKLGYHQEATVSLQK